MPPAVDEELGRWIGGWSSLRPPWISSREVAVTPADDWRSWREAGVLQAGEAQALSLARQLRADWFLTDDAAARLVASRLGFEVHGSLGVVLWAAAMEHLNAQEAREALERLFGSSLWVSARVRAEALAAVEALSGT